MIRSLFFAAVAIAYFFYCESVDESRTSGIVVLTGASSGIGRDAACFLAGQGFDVIAGVRKVHDVEAACPGVAWVQLDVTSQDDVDRLVQRVGEKRGRLVALVNNAGVGSGRIPLQYDEWANAEKLFAVNYFGVLRVSKAFIPLLQRDSSRLILISSASGGFASPGSTIYAGTKTAAEYLVKGIALELYRWNVRAVSIRPGYVKSKIALNRKADIERVAASVPSELRHLYPGWWRNEMRGNNNFAAKIAAGIEPIHVSRAIKRAIVARRPPQTIIVAPWKEWFAFRTIPYWPEALADYVLHRMGGYQ